jgi:hypothetical protein
MRTARRQLREAMRADAPDEAAVRSAAGAVAALQADQAALQARARSQFMKALTPEQQAQMKQVRARAAERAQRAQRAMRAQRSQRQMIHRDQMVYRNRMMRRRTHWWKVDLSARLRGCFFSIPTDDGGQDQHGGRPLRQKHQRE